MAHRLEVRGASPHTIKAYAYDLLTLYAWLSETGRRLQDLNESDFTELIARERHRGQQPRSINRRLSTLRLVFQFVTGNEIEAVRNSTRTARHYRGPGRERNLGLHSLRKPARVALRVKEPAKLVEPLTPEQVWAFLATLRRYRDVAMISMPVAGCRETARSALRQKIIPARPPDGAQLPFSSSDRGVGCQPDRYPPTSARDPTLRPSRR